MFGVLSTARRASELANFCCDVTLNGAASDQHCGSTDQAHPVKKPSRIETILRRSARRNSLNAFNFDASARTITTGLRSHDEKMKIVVLIVEILIPQTRTLSAISMIYKDLDLFQNGPRLANCVVPAHVNSTGVRIA